MSHLSKKRIINTSGDKGRPLSKVLRQWFKKHGFSPQLVQYGEPMIRRFTPQKPTTEDVENVGLMIAFLDKISQLESDKKVEKEIMSLIKKGFKKRKDKDKKSIEEDLIPFFREMLARHAWMFPHKHPVGWMPPSNLLTKTERKLKINGTLASWTAMESAALEFLDLPSTAYVFLNQSHELRRIVNQLDQTTKEKLQSIKKVHAKQNKEIFKKLKEKLDFITGKLEEVQDTRELWKLVLPNADISFLITRDLGIKAREVFASEDARWILKAAKELQPKGAHLDLLVSLVFSVHDLIPEKEWLSFFNSLDTIKKPLFIQLAAFSEGNALDDHLFHYFEKSIDNKEHSKVLGCLLLAIDRIHWDVKELILKIAKSKWLTTPELAAAIAVHVTTNDLPTLISIARKKKDPPEQLVFIQMFTYFALLHQKEIDFKDYVEQIKSDQPPSRNLQIISKYVEKLLTQKWFLEHFQAQVIPLRLPAWMK